MAALQQKLSYKPKSDDLIEDMYVNGRSLGRKNCGFEEEYQTIYTFAYEPGTLEVAAYIDGAETGRDILKTANAAKELIITADRSTMKADGRDLCFITIEAVDEAGNRVFLETETITVEVQGAELLALGTADPKPDRLIPYQGSQVSLYEGRALAVVRSSEGQKGCLVQVKLGDKCEASTGIGYVPAETSSFSLISEPKSGALELPLGRLLEKEAAREIVNQLIPGITENPMIEHMKDMPLKKMAAMSGAQFDAALVENPNQIMGV